MNMGKTLKEMSINAQNCLYYTKEYELGYKYALEAFMKNPDNPETKYLFAVALYFNDRCDEALKYFFELEKMSIYEDALPVYIAHCLSKTRKNLFLALKYINKADRLYHYDEETKINIMLFKAEIQYRMGDLDSAKNNFQKAFEMGDDDKSLCYLAQIYFDKNEPIKAMKYLRKVLKLGRTNKEKFWQNVEKLTYEELKQILIVLLNRYETEENKRDTDSDMYDTIQRKLGL